MIKNAKTKLSLSFLTSAAMLFIGVLPALAASAPAAPSNLGATAISSSRIDLSWTDNSTNETGFKIERGTDGVNFSQIDTVGANVTTYQSTGLNVDSTYYYRVRAYNNKNSAYSNTASATTLPNPPAAPSSLTASTISQTQINLAWTDNSDNETGFSIEKYGTSGYYEIATVGANTTSYPVTGLEAGTAYQFRVKAYNTGGDSSYSNVASATTTVNPPATPTDLTADAISETEIDLAWSDNSDNETGFKIEKYGTSSYYEIATVGANVTSYPVTGLSAGTEYSFRVRAYNAGGDSSYSNIASATTTENPPAAPTNLGGFASSTMVVIYWNDNSNNETGFIIERGLDGVNFSQVGTSTYNYYLDFDVIPYETYYYRVKAYNNAGDSDYSNILEINNY